MTVAVAMDPVLLGGFIPARASGSIDVIGAVPTILTPLTATLLHGGLLHLGFNLLMLVWCGRQVELPLTPRYFALLYVLGAYGSALGQWLWSPSDQSVMIGASGAISAVMGFYALVFSNQRVRAIGPISATVVRVIWLAAAWIGVQILMGIGFSSGGSTLAVGAHIGGFLVGLAMARPLLWLRFRGA